MMNDEKMMRVLFSVYQLVTGFSHHSSKTSKKIILQKMTIQELKKTPIIYILRKLNIDTVEKKKEEFWFKAPWRNEQTASVKCQNNLFYDFAEGIGGNIFDFVMRLKECDFKEALHFLQNEFDSFSFHQSGNNFPKKIETKQSYSVIKIQKLQNTILKEYLKTRSLDFVFCKRYLVEVYYLLNDKKYFGIGFENDFGGIEIRNKYVKLCLGKKWFTHLKNQSQRLIVLESWSDYISLLTIYPNTEINFDFIILNSLSMLSKIETLFNNYSQIIFALDNDEAGNNGTLKYVEILKEKSLDIRYLFSEVKDLNDFLIKKNSPNFNTKII